MWNKRKKLILAVLGSVVIHVVMLFVFALLIAMKGKPPDVAAATAPKPIRLQIVHEEKKPAKLVSKTEPRGPKRMIDTSDLAEADRPPENTAAEADKNTAARSEEPPTGTEALPSQKGAEIPAFMFDTHKYAAAESKGAPAPPVAPPVPQTAPPLPRPVEQAARPLATPAVAPTPAPKPAPTADPNEFALIEPTPTPKPPDFDPFVREPQTEPPGPTPVAAAAPPGGQSSSAEKSAMRGNLTNRGPSSLAAMATPQGRYSRAVSEAIRQRWNAQITKSMDLVSFGTVKIHFSLDPRGKVIAPRIVTNTGNEALASISMAAILDAKIPPVPPEVTADSESTDLPLDFDFSLY